MNTYIALFRGINVGGRNKVVMKDLVSSMHKNGFEDVRTYIQSGNVVFKGANKSESEISSLVETNFGFKPEVLVLTLTDLERAIENNPFSEAEGKACHFYFCNQEIKLSDFEKLDALKLASEEYVIKENVFYLHAPDGVGRSKLAAKVESCIGLPVTARNLNTVLKLQGMVNSN
ncbi:DUF1697 domain-containing protein [Alteromonadaceae bacterium M269]|nr:DUF1697 domain-containing protein [Alteromonadaceae bacterium M269]